VAANRGAWPKVKRFAEFSGIYSQRELFAVYAAGREGWRVSQ
jgi:hypothetical protein